MAQRKRVREGIWENSGLLVGRTAGNVQVRRSEKELKGSFRSHMGGLRAGLRGSVFSLPGDLWLFYNIRCRFWKARFLVFTWFDK